MTQYRSNLDLAQAAQLIREAGHVTITTHAKPDGDAYGSVVALGRALQMMSVDFTAWFMPPVGQNLETLPGRSLVRNLTDHDTLGSTDLVVITDTGAISQLAPVMPQLQSHLEHTLIVDHHLGGDLPAAWRYVDSAAASSCEIMADLIDQLGVEMADPVIRDALFVGIAADTGWFRFSNTRPQTHEKAARLLRAGVNHSDLYAALEQNDRPEKLALMIRALDSLTFLAAGSIAMMVVRASDFTVCGADAGDTEQFVDLPQIVGVVRVVVLVTQPPFDVSAPCPPVRLSFRSKPGPNAVNVADLAERFGGGGHARAAGAKLDATIDEAVERVTAALTSA